ncbi:MAG: DUF4294 domain-containing protein [Leeuwenhoekiella sp.]
MKHTLTFFLFFVSFWANAQRDTIPIKDTLDHVEYYIIQGDSVPASSIGLEAVVVLGKLQFDDDAARKRYLILRRKTRKVYPYAKLAAERFTQINARLDSMDSKRDRKKYMKVIQKYVEEEFGDRLKKFSRTEGQILVKLLHRQTGITGFDLIKEYRNGWKAFWLNTTAGLFDISLKTEYDPINVEEDYLIEDILERSFQANLLERQESALDFNYFELENKWRPIPDLED